MILGGAKKVNDSIGLEGDKKLNDYRYLQRGVIRP